MRLEIPASDEMAPHLSGTSPTLFLIGCELLRRCPEGYYLTDAIRKVR